MAKKPQTLEQRVDAAIAQDGTFDLTVHGLAMECLAHAQSTGDFTLMARLIGDCKTAGGVVFGKGVRSRRLGIIEWLGQYSPIRVSGAGVIGALPKTAKTFKEYDLEAAEANPFYDGKAEAARRTKNNPFDVATILGRVGSFTSSIDKAIESGSLNDDETALRLLATELNAFAAKRARELGLNSDEAKARRTKAA